MSFNPHGPSVHPRVVSPEAVMTSRKTGIVCAARGCHNNWYKRKGHLEQECFDHRPRTRAECGCGAPYDLHPPPKNKEHLRLWLKALNLKKPPKRPYVCSFHFVNRGPTEDHPLPEKWLGYEVPANSHDQDGGHCDATSMMDPGQGERMDSHHLPKDNAGTKACSDSVTGESFGKALSGMRKRKAAMQSLYAWKSMVKPARRSISRGPPSLWKPPPHPDHDYSELILPLEEKLKHFRKMVSQKDELMAQIKAERFLIARFQGDHRNIMFYTGFPDYYTFIAGFMALQPTAESIVRWSQAQRLKQADMEVLRQGFSISKLAIIDQFFLFLCRVRQGLPEQDLAIHFNVSQSTVSRICATWTSFLHFMLGSFAIWPSRANVWKVMPSFFRDTYPHTRVILDCMEINVQKPSSKVVNSEMFPHYKDDTTLKSLIGIAPSGELIFVSQLYAGSLSEKELTKSSGILPLLEGGDEVMAVKGFPIQDLLSGIDVSLVIPPSFSPNGNRLRVEAKHVHSITRLRAHVERAFKRIKEYHIFDRVLPVTLFGSVNQLWTVCALLSSFKGPLL